MIGICSIVKASTILIAILRSQVSIIGNGITVIVPIAIASKRVAYNEMAFWLKCDTIDF